MDRPENPRIWQRRPNLSLQGLSCSKILSFIRWSFQILMLAAFWIIILPPLIRKSYFLYPEQGRVIREVIIVCIRPPFEELLLLMGSVFVLNLIFNLMMRYYRPSYSNYHIMSIVLGYMALQINCTPGDMILVLGFLMLIFMLIARLKALMDNEVQIIRPVYIVAITLTTILCLGEIFYPYESNWQECRVVMAIIGMKTISIASDDYTLKRISYQELLGYLLCPANIVFGPWMSYDTYTLYYVYRSKLNWKWGFKLVQSFTYAMIYIVISNCLKHSLIPVEDATFLPVKWLEAFRNSFVFRAHNYFIGYLGEFTMISAGFNAFHHYDAFRRWSYPVTRPFKVEGARSMQGVAENWNIPAYRFLKECVYIPFSEVGPGYAITMTYLQATLLYGLKIRVMMILLNVILLAHSQQRMQKYLARWLNCCCQATSCHHTCHHRYRTWHPMTLVINGFNVLLNIMHLAYLGHIMHDDFGTKSLIDLYQVWGDELGIYSHISSFVWCSTLFTAH